MPLRSLIVFLLTGQSRVFRQVPRRRLCSKVRALKLALGVVTLPLASHNYGDMLQGTEVLLFVTRWRRPHGRGEAGWSIHYARL